MSNVDNLLPKSEDELTLRDKDGTIKAGFVAAVEQAVESHDAARAKALAGDLHEADLGALLEAMDSEARPRLIELMGADFDFAALTEVDDNVREEILDELENATVAEGMRDLNSDDQVSILEDLDKADQDAVLGALPAMDRVNLQRSLDYPEDSAGRLMQTALVTVPPFWTVGQTIDRMRDVDGGRLPDSFFEVFIVDATHRLLGNVFLDRLLRSKRPVRMDAIMQADRRRVKVSENREVVARTFARYNLVSVPVVDDGDRLVGMITIDDIVDVIQEVADDDLKALGGVRAGEELSDTVAATSKSRFPWLFVNLITAFAASVVLWLFDAQLGKMVQLAVLAPIVASQGGNAATQTMTVAVRALATRELSGAQVSRVIWREILVGCFNGIAFGVITGLMASLWFGLQGLGVCIALAMLTNLVAGALGGIFIPLVLDRFKFDPAVSSGAFVTTVTDLVGYSSFLTIATIWFNLW